jgi:TRAP-type uncharacterized transport system substrate-binding protein
MLRSFLTFCLLISLAAAVASAQEPLSAQEPDWDFVVSSGKEGGFYYDVGKRLRLVLGRQQRAVDQWTSEGSLQNLARLADPSSPVNVALAQADALHRYLAENPEFAKDFIVLDDIGKECVFFITRREGGIENASDLKKASGLKVSVETPGSGAAVTYEAMSQLEPAYRKTPVAYVDVMEGLLQLRLGGEYNELAAVMLVQRPRTLSPALEIVLDNLETYRIAPVRQTDLKKLTLPGGRPVYSFETVKAGFGRGQSVTLETLCTRGLLLGARSKLSDERRVVLAQTVLESGSYIAPGSD